MFSQPKRSVSGRIRSAVPQSAASQTHDPQRFLIVDDHPLFRDALYSAVSIAFPAAQTCEAGSIEEAVEELDKDSGFDLALLDLSIPGVKGFEGLLHLRANYPRLPFVVVSGQ